MEDHQWSSFEEMMNKNQWCIVPYQDDGHIGQANFTKSMQNDELVRDNLICYVIKCEINNEYAIHAIDLFENDDAFLKVLDAKIEYLVRHEKRSYKH